MTQESAAPSGKRAERSRRAIVSAARDMFIRDGFDVGMDVIAAAAGVSKMTVYNHFRSKDELFRAVIGEALDGALGATLEAIRACFADTADIREALARTAEALIAGVTRPEVLALRNLVTSELRRFPDLGRAWQDSGPARVGHVLADAFQDLTDQGRLAMPDPRIAALQFFSLTLYPHLVASSFGSDLPPHLADRLRTDGLDMFLHRYLPAP
jgi:TetR/AcrR family transcriptional repressor of mexJK operon